MRKLSTTVILLFSLYLNARAQNIPSLDSTRQFLSGLKKTTAGSERLEILIKLGSYYLYKVGEVKSDLDSADLFLNQAKELSAKLKLSKIQNKVSYLKAEVLFERGDLPKARVAYLQAIDNYMRSSEKEGAAQAWFSMQVRTMYLHDSTAMRGMRGFEHALHIYRELHNKAKEAKVIQYAGDWLIAQGRLDEAENELLTALSIYKSIDYKKLHYTYDRLAQVSIIKGNFNQALYYSLEMIKSVQATGDTARAYALYSRIADVYKNLKEDDKSRYWYNRALVNESGAKNPRFFYDINDSLIGLMIKEGKIKEALEFLLKLIKKRPPIDELEKLTVATRLGECYSLLGKDDLAEKYYQQAVTNGEKAPDIQGGIIAKKTMADFYLSRKRYGQAGIYLHKVLAVPRGIVDVGTIRETYYMLFQADSATGNYLSAIKNYQQYKSLTDSIFTVAKSKQITELQLQYEKDQKVRQLENKGKLQQAQLQQAGTLRNFIIAGAGLLFISLVLGYQRYRQKQHSNQLLQAQQQEINLINQSLQLTVAEKDSLLTEKDNLLEEKEWLMKEIHHRVKNNLQIVISLLNTQSNYITNDIAFNAIRESQHRMQSISLIHQKLYQSESRALIEAHIYMAELIEYLSNSFDTGNRIHFEKNLAELELDVSRAVPIGLILNEAITNSIKYAFPNNADGCISVSLSCIEEDNFRLCVSDNGIGLPEGFDIAQCRSLGMNLMRGLCKQIGSSLRLENNKGLSISIDFKDEKLLEPSLN